MEIVTRLQRHTKNRCHNRRPRSNKSCLRTSTENEEIVNTYRREKRIHGACVVLKGQTKCFDY